MSKSDLLRVLALVALGTAAGILAGALPPYRPVHRVATPVNWKQGEDVIIAGSVSDDEARTIWPDGWQAPRPYIRIVPQPS